jgi:hypothetical protein
MKKVFALFSIVLLLAVSGFAQSLQSFDDWKKTAITGAPPSAARDYHSQVLERSPVGQQRLQAVDFFMFQKTTTPNALEKQYAVYLKAWIMVFNPSFDEQLIIKRSDKVYTVGLTQISVSAPPPTNSPLLTASGSMQAWLDQIQFRYNTVRTILKLDDINGFTTQDKERLQGNLDKGMWKLMVIPIDQFGITYNYMDDIWVRGSRFDYVNYFLDVYERIK